MRGKRPEGPEGSIRSFGLRVLDNLFRHRVLFALPLLMFTALGVNQLRSDVPLYESTAVVRIGTNPNVSRQLVPGANFSFRESGSEGTIRLIKEQFGTRRFATNVTERAGLGDAIGAGWGVLEAVRSSVEFDSTGDALMSVTASWSDPSTSLALVEETIGTYEAYLAEITTNAAAEAEQFYRVVLDEAQDIAATHENELAEYVDSLPPIPEGAEYNIAETVEIERREIRVERARTDVAAAQKRLNAAMLANTRANAENATAFVTVDAARLANEPVSTTSRDLKTVIAYFVMGAVVSGAAVLVTTSVDHAFTAPAELARMPGVEAVALAPPIRRHSMGFRWRRPHLSDRGDDGSDEHDMRTSVPVGRGRSPLAHRPSPVAQGRS